jgi:E3 ubiquitin-protein ligase TRIP12
LLRVVHALTIEARDVSARHDQMDENLFVNNKLTAKLTRQLEEIMILAG